MSIDIALKLAAALAGVLAILSIFPGPSWPIKIRILIVFLLGMVVLGVFAWPLVAPAEPFGIVSMPGFTPSLIIIVLAIAVGFAGYFVTWPYGTYMGVIAVPAGTVVWAVRSGQISNQFISADVNQRMEIFHSLQGESFFWLLVVAAGLVGVLIARLILKPHKHIEVDDAGEKPRLSTPVNAAVALFASVVISFVIIILLAQNVKLPDARLGNVIAQPSNGQIGFAVFTAFAAASFLTKKFLDTSYIYPAVSSALVSFLGIVVFSRKEITEHITSSWPANFFANPIVTILPVQMVSFGVLGAIAGFWLVESLEIWRNLERQAQ
ncbi:MAG: hypothetical protein WC374_03830 [Phycisphaerae bacterium]